MAGESRPASAGIAPLSEAAPLLLASGSPRRREILTNLGIPHLVTSVNIDESVLPGETPEAYLVRVTAEKLAAASKSFLKQALAKLEPVLPPLAALERPPSSEPGAAAPRPPFVNGDPLQAIDVASAARAVLVADTSVIDGATILGKPSGPEEAEQMIARLAGRTHEVWTRFAIGAPESPARALHEETVKTRVTFRPLTAERVKAYVKSGEGTDKAGAYAIQGRGAGLVSRIEGSYSNVVGLPACEVMVALENLGLWS